MSLAMLAQNVDAGVTLSRHSILNKFILASMSLGLVATIATTWRDVSIGIPLTNSVMNILVVAALAAAWHNRHELSVVFKSSVLFCLYLFVGCKNIFLFGPHSAGIVFLGYCSMIMALVLPTRWAIVFASLISL